MDNKFKRVILIVLDSVGMGALPDAHKFGDYGVNTINNVAKKLGGLNIPNMIDLGLGNIEGMREFTKVIKPKGSFARLAEVSAGKDTTIGHWEMTGIVTKTPFPTYPNGFPKEVMDKFLEKTGEKGYLGNCTASGTTIIAQLGKEHMDTGYPIIYTSADSVFQIAAHEEVIPVDRLYEICEIARKMLKDEHAVARVIARPFVGEPGNFTRTSNRRDFSLKPTTDNVLCSLKDAGLDVLAVGKIEDIFAGVGITEAIHTKDNQDGIDKTIEYMNADNRGLIFTNLVEFDSKWGHRNDYEGYGRGLEEFDARLPEIMAAMKDDDLLMITADHGCDPTTEGTDHTREYVPLLMYSKNAVSGRDFRTGDTFANIGQTIADIFDLEPLASGISYLTLL